MIVTDLMNYIAITDPRVVDYQELDAYGDKMNFEEFKYNTLVEITSICDYSGAIHDEIIEWADSNLGKWGVDYVWTGFNNKKIKVFCNDEEKLILFKMIWG